MLIILKWGLLLGILFLLVNQYRRTRQFHDLLIIISGSLLVLLKVGLPYLTNHHLTLGLSLLTLLICVYSGWWMIKDQK